MLSHTHLSKEVTATKSKVLRKIKSHLQRVYRKQICREGALEKDKINRSCKPDWLRLRKQKLHIVASSDPTNPHRKTTAFPEKLHSQKYLSNLAKELQFSPGEPPVLDKVPATAVVALDWWGKQYPNSKQGLDPGHFVPCTEGIRASLLGIFQSPCEENGRTTYLGLHCQKCVTIHYTFLWLCYTAM